MGEAILPSAPPCGERVSRGQPVRADLGFAVPFPLDGPRLSGMKSPSVLVLTGLAVLALTGCGDSSKQSKAGVAVSNAVTAPIEYIGAGGRALRMAEKTADLAGVNQAIQIFLAQEGRYPKSLDELVEQQLLPQSPPAPHGMKLVYDPQTGRVSAVPLPSATTNAPTPTR